MTRAQIAREFDQLARRSNRSLGFALGAFILAFGALAAFFVGVAIWG